MQGCAFFGSRKHNSPPKKTEILQQFLAGQKTLPQKDHSLEDTEAKTPCIVLHDLPQNALRFTVVLFLRV